jgi:peptidoglycan/xylan/chitin deacetylase (PgdA/CDA1 family)
VVPNLAGGADPFPSTGFTPGESNAMPGPAFIPNNYVIPTLDDVADGVDTTMGDGYYPGNWTKRDLLYLDGKGDDPTAPTPHLPTISAPMHWDFFMNTDNWAGPINDTSADDPDAHADFVDILALHNPANHTIHHIHMGSSIAPDTTQNPPIPQSCDGALSMDTCDAEIQGVETVIGMFSGGKIPHLTRFRAPYGEPFQTMGTGIMDVQAVVAKYAVMVGWDFLTHDADNSPPNATDTVSYVEGQIKTHLGTGPGAGGWGVLLMHGVLPWTHDSLDDMFNPTTGYLATHGFKLATVEDVICWKYGMHSWDVINTINHYTGAQMRGPN